MITAVDTNVLLDVFLPDDVHLPRSSALLRLAYDQGALVISHLACAEPVPQFGDKAILGEALAKNQRRNVVPG